MNATMTKHPNAYHPSPRETARRLALLTLAASTIALTGAPAAGAGTYPMYQCAPGATALATGWSVYGNYTSATTVLANGCSNGGDIGDYVFTNGQAGAVTESGDNGSQTGLTVNVPGSAPNVTIQSITAQVTGSSVTGDDAFLGFSSAGQALPGTTELPYGGGDYTTSESWTLLQGARDFEAYVNCSTDLSSPTCYFADPVSVPALSNITLTLKDNTPPALTSISGALATAAADKSTVTGAQALSFSAGDTDSGVRSATLTLTPQGGAAPYTHTFDFITQCAYDSWNACPLTQTVNAFALNTSSLKDDTYTINLAATDAAGNQTSDTLGTILSHNAPANTSPPTIFVTGDVLVGAALTTQAGAWSAPAGAGTITYTYQWQQCDAQGDGCKPIAGAQNAGYTPAPSDIGHTLRVLVTATDNDGSTTAASAPTGAVPGAVNSLGAMPGPGTPNNPNTQHSPTGPDTSSGPAAGPTAQLRLGIRRTISRTFKHSAFQLTGRLLNPQGQPIADATLDVLQQAVGSSSPRVVAHAKTGSDGSFAARVPAGPSRLIDVAYPAPAGNTGYAAQARVAESVNAAVKLSITPRSTSPDGTILLTGKVQGPIPQQGTIVELLVHYRGHWEPFRTPRTDSSGNFQVAYQFQGGTGRFPFRAEIPAGQTDFPYSGGYSNVVDVAAG